LKSPCAKVCVMDPESGLCRGCWRTLEEIAAWGSMSEEQRERIMSELPSRSSDIPKVAVPPLA
jgi:hypothetical protein